MARASMLALLSLGVQSAAAANNNSDVVWAVTCQSADDCADGGECVDYNTKAPVETCEGDCVCMFADTVAVEACDTTEDCGGAPRLCIDMNTDEPTAVCSHERCACGIPSEPKECFSSSDCWGGYDCVDRLTLEPTSTCTTECLCAFVEEQEGSCSSDVDCPSAHCLNKNGIYPCVEDCFCGWPCELADEWEVHNCEHFNVQEVECLDRILPGATHECGHCKVEVSKTKIQAFGGSCASYCRNQGLGCRSAYHADSWDSYTCAHHGSLGCFETATETSDAAPAVVCECEDIGLPKHRSVEPYEPDMARACHSVAMGYEECRSFHETNWPGSFHLETFPEELLERMARESRGAAQCASIKLEKFARIQAAGCAK